MKRYLDQDRIQRLRKGEIWNTKFEDREVFIVFQGCEGCSLIWEVVRPEKPGDELQFNFSEAMRRVFYYN